MPRRCCVKSCKNPKGSVFKFPNEEVRRHAWIRAIKRENGFNPSKHSGVCQRHFKPEEIVTETSAINKTTGIRLRAKLGRPYLTKNAIPSLFPDSLTVLMDSMKKEDPSQQKVQIKQEAAENELWLKHIEALALQKERKITSYLDLKNKLSKLIKIPWTVMTDENSVDFCNIIKHPAPLIKHSVVVDKFLNIKVYFEKVQINHIGTFKIPLKLEDIDTLTKILDNLLSLEENHEDTTPDQSHFMVVIKTITSLISTIKSSSNRYFPHLKFINEQLSLMTQKKYSYSNDIMIFTSLLYNISSKAYKFLRDSEFFILPCLNSVKRLKSKTFNPNDEKVDYSSLKYMKQKFRNLKSIDKTVILMVNEISTTADITCKEDESNHKKSKGAMIFMISSMLSNFKHVVQVIPMKSLNSVNLQKFIKNLIIGIEGIGLNVLSILMDNNQMSRESVSLFTNPPHVSFVYPHPVDNYKPLFVLYDCIQILKGVRNDWINQKAIHKSMMFPRHSSFDEHLVSPNLYAPLNTLIQLQNLSETVPLEPAFKFNRKVLSPPVADQQEFSLVTELFSEKTVQALRTHGVANNIPHAYETSSYINIMTTWWNIVSVQTEEGKSSNNLFQWPLTSNITDERYIFLQTFFQWLCQWEEYGYIEGSLTDNTLLGLKMTTHALIELANYVINELDHKYILPGKFQRAIRHGFFRV